MTDIVERLRDYGGEDHAEPGSFHHQICREAAAEIEHLRRKVVFTEALRDGALQEAAAAHHVNEELSEDVQTLRQFDPAQRDEIERLRALVRCLVENNPDDDAADGVTVLDVWRKDAIRALKEKASD